ncbi:MAG TPA: hypothetical protein VGN42_09155 [Pirellulales bacterium]|jgi:hypothetical protein|nr:hypothetical protein [Pirellulales bacterium]
MIAFAQPFHDKPAASSKPAWYAGFMALLPDIRRHVRFAFRRLAPDRREEAIQEALANALVAYIRLYDLGKTAVAYATPLADYAVLQVCDGRQVACPLNSYDVLSPYAQRKQGFAVSRLQRPDETEGTWKEILVEDPTCTPAELAASRLDFEAWLRRLPRHKRRVASTLAGGETTCGAARKFRITPGRVSQLRRELAENWDVFNGEPKQALVAAC